MKIKYLQEEINKGLIGLMEKRLNDLKRVIQSGKDEIYTEVDLCIDAEKIAGQESINIKKYYAEERSKLVEKYNKKRYIGSIL